MVHSAFKRGADYIGKVVLVGRGRVGKSTFSRKFVDGKFDEDYSMTIGASHAVKTIPVPEFEKTVKFTIWDLAGQRKFRSLVSNYTRGAQGVLYFCSLQDPKEELQNLTIEEKDAFKEEKMDSIKEIEHWAPIVEKTAPEASKILVATKLDLIPEGKKASKIEEILTQSKNTFGFGGTELLTKQEFGQRMRTALEEQVFDFYPYDLETTKFKAMNLEDQMELSILRFPVYFVSSKTGQNVERIMQDLAKEMLEKGKRKQKGLF